MDSHDIDDLLKNSTIFSSLDKENRKKLVGKITVVNLVEDEVLFYQGDPSESIYIVAKGKLSAILISGLNQSRIAGYLLPGEMLGEMGVLINEPRSLTVKALINSTVLKISAKQFLEIFHQSQAVMNALIYPIISRSVDLIKMLSTDKQNKNIVIFPGTKDTSLENFFSVLCHVAEKFLSTLIVSDYQLDFSDKNISVDVVKNRIKILIESRKKVHRICYILSSFDTPLAKVAYQRASMIYVAVNANEEPKIDSHVLDKIKSKVDELNSQPHLIVIHPPKTSAPHNTIEWLKLAKFDLHHHVRIDKTKDLQRLLRFIRGKAVGLILGGGGTRGWAHIGAIKAILDAKIPIDIIGGTSVGAMVAGMYAMCQSYENTYKQFSQIVIESENSISWRGLTWPILSLFNAKKYTNAQMNIFKKTKVENLWIPYFCITSNLATNLEEVHKTGLLWEVIRASTSIPGIIPPMLLNGEIHFDGGLLNNLPTDVMRRLIGQNGKIIAIQLNNALPDKNKYHFPPILTLKEVLLNKLGIKKYHYQFPPFLDTFLHGLFLNAQLKDNTNAAISNIFVSLNLARFKMLYANPEEGGKLIQIGYEETMKQINKTKNKNILPA